MPSPKQKRKYWSAKEDQFLENHINKMTNEEIGLALNRTILSISNRIAALKLKRKPEVTKAQKAVNHFKKGHKTWNKGMKGLRLSPHSEFKKGNLPHNAKEDGEITIHTDKCGAKYKLIRLSLGVWQPYHRYVWEQAHGPIPKSTIITFKNKDTLDCRLENLKLISRADNLRRNANREKAAKSLQEQWDSGRRYENNHWVASMIAYGKPDLKKEILENHQDLIEIKRKQLKLRRKIKDVTRGKT